MSKYTARLEDWGVVEGKNQLFGNVFEDSKGRFDDGQFVKTSPAFDDPKDLKEGDLVSTKSSVYLLGKRQPDYDAKLEDWFVLPMNGGLCGYIYGDKKERFPDSSQVYTTKVVEGEVEPFNVVRTRNTSYLLGKRYNSNS
ncbi:hypothetical protein EVB81_210 [Rhizobium phage RHph_I46]|uniref:Uncharacterized protein n=1 Tax=Rhizobium phage RHph_I1_9 TaxID=2509729 RepID=A0A7S5RF00_9CAUD|nr:hypothetical protein PP936_gp208 [Rhizobium phage RHph_I1_9]QIG69779.1 hypothetical protein EVB81_210 [Rhizobium phage RHph_I46]QIG71060.1 hypothetical protein EVB92_210 [Rhizobium phage RHph_I9]QIG73645.1 hypothetical protein EVC04_208 [Rhizobium phage RHph_I1_9]QIG76399.1 hypothetical protein EVC25_210 [Rhizobium phage RHph_I34]